MKKKYCFFSRFLLSTIACGALLATHTSCINDDYDMSDENLDKEIVVGGSLALPVGTLPITLREILEDANIEELEEVDGVYKISLSESFEESLQITDATDIEIDPIVIEKTINSEFEEVEFPDFSFDIDDANIDIIADIEQVKLSEPTTINKSRSGASVTLPNNIDFTIADVSVSQQMPLSSGDQQFDLLIAGVEEMPLEVVSASNIKFGDNGVVATFKVDLSVISSAFKSDGLSIVLPYVEITMPEGFVIDGGDNYSKIENIEANNLGVVECLFTISSYDKTLYNVNGKLDEISGDIECKLPNYVDVSGTTNGSGISSTEISTSFQTTFEITDMDLVAENIPVDVEGINISSEVIIDEIPTLIKSVGDIYLENSMMNITIAPIDIASLKSQSQSDIIYLQFPKSKYLIENSDGSIIETNSLYQIPIDLGDIIGGVAYNKQLTISALKLGGETLERVTIDGKEKKRITFDTEISTTNTTLMIGGDISLADYNSFIDSSEEATIEITTGEWSIESAEIETDCIIAEFSDETESFEIETTIPTELIRIDSLLFSNEKQVTVDINIVVNVEVDSELSFENYQIEFPEFIKFAENAGVVDQKLILNDNFIQSSSNRYQYEFSRSLEIEKLDFTAETYDSMIKSSGDNKTLLIDESIDISGGIKVASADIDGDISTQIEAIVAVEVCEMEVQKAYGIVDTQVEIDSTEIDLSDISEEFDGEGFSAVLSSPSITLTAVNELTIPVEITDLILQPVKDGVNKDKISLEEGSVIIINAANENSAATTKVCLVASEEQKGSDEDVQYVVLNNLKNVLDGLPDKILLEIETCVATPTDGTNHMVDLSVESYNFSVDYSIDIPLEFDDFNLEYTATIDGLNSDLEDILSYITTLSLELTVDNTLPFNIEISSITPIGVEGDVLDLPSIITEGSSTIEAESEGSVIKLNLEDNDDKLQYLEAFDIEIKVYLDSNVNNKTLGPDQSIELSMKVFIPDGLTINLGDND